MNKFKYVFYSVLALALMAVPALAHRLVLDPQARFAGLTAQGVVEEVLRAVPVPS